MLIPCPLHCPYCGESIEVLLEPDTIGEVGIEDCQVCCRPIRLIRQQGPAGQEVVQALREDETP